MALPPILNGKPRAGFTGGAGWGRPEAGGGQRLGAAGVERSLKVFVNICFFQLQETFLLQDLQCLIEAGGGVWRRGGGGGGERRAQQIKIVQNNSLSVLYPEEPFAKAEVGRTGRRRFLKSQMLPFPL